MSAIDPQQTATGGKDNKQILLESIVRSKIRIALLKTKRRLLLAELYRQYLDGETEPKKRLLKFTEPAPKKAKASKAETIIKKENEAVADQVINNNP